MRKKSIFSILTLVFFLTIVSLNTSCKTGEGCDNLAKYEAPDLDDKKSQKRGKSGLFSKKQKKKRKRK